jgi:pimeloyl-ACP methyl ester carboxylesterase
MWEARNVAMIEDARGKIDYHEQGSGPTIMFVPGSWGTRSAWRGVIAALPGRFRIVTTSLLGYGYTAERRAGTHVRIECEAEILETVMLRARAPLHVVGHSYAGQVCLAVAIRKIAQLTSLTVIEPTVFPLLRQTGDLALYEEVATMHAAYVRAFDAGDKEAARHVIDFVGGKGTFDTLPDRMREYVVATTTTNILDWQCGLGFDAPLSAYAGITAPTLILCGESGHPSIVRAAEILLGAMPRAALKAIPGASHFMMATHPADIAAFVREHVLEAETM